MCDSVDKEVFEEAYATLKHPNVASLIGYKAGDFGALLIYERFDHSVQSVLENPTLAAAFTWPQRVGMLRSVARGLHFISSTPSRARQRTVRDLRCSTIVCDRDLCRFRIIDPGLTIFSGDGPNSLAGSLG